MQYVAVAALGEVDHVHPGVFGWGSGPVDDMDIGDALLLEYAGMGRAHEAASAVMGHARQVLGVGRVLAIVSEDYASSIRRPGKLGFDGGGVVRTPGSERDVRLFVAGLA